MKVRPFLLCLLGTALSATPALVMAETKPAAPMTDSDGKMEKRRQEMLQRFDKNGDGKLDDDEKAAMKEALKQERGPRGPGDIGGLAGGAAAETVPGAELYVREIIKRFDKDGDGKLDATELTEALKARAAGGAAGGQFRQQMIKMFDKNGDGVLDESERAEAQKFRDEQIQRFDKNGDGQLDPEERAEAMKAFLSDHPELVPPGK